MATPKEHIEEIRRTKFSIGGEVNPLREDLHQAVKNLSAELYAKDVHFLMEIIQNAEDNEYNEGVKPSLEFIITSRDITATGASATLLVFNNEKGFSPKISIPSAVWVVPRRKATANAVISERKPCIFSNGYQIRFSEEPCPQCDLGYIVPEWVEENPTIADLQKLYGSATVLPTTTIVLPLKADKVVPVKQQLSCMHPEVLLFLSKIKKLSVREDNEDPHLNTVSSVSISSETEFTTRKNIDAESYTLHLSAEENGDERAEECSYYMWRQKFPVRQENRVERRMEVESWMITLAFPNGQRLNRGMNSPGVYAFLPTEMVTNFPFIIQADFVLASSRETILLDNRWNQGIMACVPLAFVNAFVSLVRTTESAPASSLPPMFQFIPVKSSSFLLLNTVRESIKEKLVEENIMPCQSYTEQKFFYKPCQVGRILPAFWKILNKAWAQNVSLHNLSSHGKYILNFAFEKEQYNDVLNFLGVKPVNDEWYVKCIQSSNLVLGVSEDVYLELLLFISNNWWSSFQNTSIRSTPLLKYVGQDGYVSLWSINEVTRRNGRRVRLSCYSHQISWLIDWNQEFRCSADWFFVPKSTQEALQLYPKRETLMEWLQQHVEISAVSVYDYASLMVNSLNSDRRLAVTFAHFLHHSFLNKFFSEREVDNLCMVMPLVDNYGYVTIRRNGVLVPANGSNWVGLIGSNPWRGEQYIELGEEYLRAGRFASFYSSEKELLKFLKIHAGASDIPVIAPPDAAIPTLSAPLTKDNAFLLLNWIRNIKYSGIKLPGKLLRCIKEGNWLKISLGCSPGYRSPSQSFFLNSALGNLLQGGSVLVDIPLVDESFYGNKIRDYEEELKTIGVMFEFGEACRFIGKHLMSLAASSNLTRSNVLSILNFIRFLREEFFSHEDFIMSIKEASWLRTSHGNKSPGQSILFDSEWKAASQISNLPFIDQEFYGQEILSFRTELQLLGVTVGFDQNYQLLTSHFCLPTSLAHMTKDTVFLILDCLRYSSSAKIIGVLKDAKWLKTFKGHKLPCECFLIDIHWGSLLTVFKVSPLIDFNFYGNRIFSYRNELKEVGVLVDFEEAAKEFARLLKQHASSSSITKENVFSLLACYRKITGAGLKLPSDLRKCMSESKWLRTNLGDRSPKESILFGSDWKSISQIASLPFIDDSDSYYGEGIREYKDELKALGVVVDFKEGAKFVTTGLNIPRNPIGISPTSVISLLECIRNIKEQSDSISQEFLHRMRRRWLKTSMGYKSPNECLLFDSKWGSFLQLGDGPFIDEEFYGSHITSYGKQLGAIGVAIDASQGCPLLAGHLDSHSQLTTIVRIYNFLIEHKWEPENKDGNWIWIPNGSDKGEWASPDDCVLFDNDGLFGLQLHVLEKHYDKKILGFFSVALGVRRHPSVDDYCKLWKAWESSGQQLTSAKCSAFWVFVASHWSKTTQKSLADDLVRLPVESGLDEISIFDKQEVFIPDDLHLKGLFEKASPHPIFVWCPQPSLPKLPRTRLLEIYRTIGVRTISESVQKDESSIPAGIEFKQIDPSEVLIGKGLLKLILGFLTDPALEMDAEKRHQTVKHLLGLTVYETVEPITVTYNLSLPSGKSLNTKARRMIRWERENGKLFTQKMPSSGHRARIEFATYFAEVISEGLLWEKEGHISTLSELIKLGFLVDFEDEAIEFMMKMKNLQLFLEDEQFLSSAFPPPKLEICSVWISP